MELNPRIFRLTVLIICLFSFGRLWAQTPFIHITQPESTDIHTAETINYLEGSTCPSCRLAINGKVVKVYPTGSFAWELDLSSPDTTLVLISTSRSGKPFRRVLHYFRRQQNTGTDYPDFGKVYFRCSPSGMNWLKPGDLLRFQVLAPLNATVQISNRISLIRQWPVSDSSAVFQGVYTLTPSDSWIDHALIATITLPDGKELQVPAESSYQLLSGEDYLVGKTYGSAPYLTYSHGSDRLGAAKMGYLDTGVLLHVVGLNRQYYKVALSSTQHAFIPIEYLSLLSKGSFPVQSLTEACRIWGHSGFDFVSLGLQMKLPYSSTLQANPGLIRVKIYGATDNTNWISRLDSVREVRSVELHQVQDGVCELDISLKHPQPWGYSINYQANNLVVQIKRPPKPLSIKNLTIVVDPGHGGSNKGTRGPTGVYEKSLTLLISNDLKSDLTHLGAHVILTRTKDTSLDMIQRRELIQHLNPDLLVSVHLNASSDPIHIQGTSTYYRYPGFQSLAYCILHRMIHLGLGNFGEVGDFNFALNGLTICPNVLVETAFLSNPSDEMKVLNSRFRQKIADAICAGIQDFISYNTRRNMLSAGKG